MNEMMQHLLLIEGKDSYVRITELGYHVKGNAK
jgi:hypothetical protein